MVENGGGFKRHEAFNLWSTPEKFWIESSKVKTTHMVQVVRDAAGAVVTVEPNLMQIPPSASRKSIYGVIGLCELPLGQALIVITRKINVGEIRGGNVFQLDCAEVIPVRWTRSRVGGGVEALKVEAHNRCLGLLTEALSTPYFYFSYSVDVTNCLQRTADQQPPPPRSGRESWERLDRRFVWNDHLLRPFVDGVKAANANGLHSFLTPLIHGAAFVRRFNLNSKLFTWAVFTRRSRFRAGTRFFARGADAEGNVANFNETEQLVEVKGKGVASFVQTRGSMPMFWSQTPNVRYKPKPILDGAPEDSEAAFAAHFAEQKRIYGSPQIAVNLIDQKGSEGVLEAKFRSLFSSSSGGGGGLVYEYFDFHGECAKMRYDRLSKLIDRMAKHDVGFCHVEAASGRIVSRQEGVFRTNCMDCLDRTNVVQSMLASENLVKVLVRLEVLPPGATVKNLESFESFHAVFRNTWADHANLISVQYAGTGALKTDFTRTGSRTKYGLVQDGWNSLVRYYKNNFSDGFRTDAMHFFLGDLQVGDVENGIVASKYRKESAGTLTANLPWAMALAVVVALLAVLLSPRMNASVLGVVVAAAAAAVFCGKTIIDNNKLFVDFPLRRSRPIKR